MKRLETKVERDDIESSELERSKNEESQSPSCLTELVYILATRAYFRPSDVPPVRPGVRKMKICTPVARGNFEKFGRR
jgi:hypothetical protein